MLYDFNFWKNKVCLWEELGETVGPRNNGVSVLFAGSYTSVNMGDFVAC